MFNFYLRQGISHGPRFHIGLEFPPWFVVTVAWSAKNRHRLLVFLLVYLRLVFDPVKALEPIECCRQLVLYPYVTILNPYVKIIYNICLIFFINASLQARRDIMFDSVRM